MRSFGCRITWPVVPALAALIALSMAHQRLTAQLTGTITGQVVAASTQRPIESAQVSIAGTGVGGLSNAQGRFLITNAPVGEHVLSVTMLGYRTAEQTVSVAPGQTAVAEFELQETAIDLEEIIVTGTPGATRRRAIGTSVASIDVERRLQDAPITTIENLISNRDAGVMALGTTGLVGAAGRIQLRGMTSMSLANQPIVYIDGIRVYEAGQMSNVGGQRTSALAEIDPGDIARVEVIKGAAATTLYGSEASNGVIQIFTKRGRTGEMTFNASTRVGFNRMPGTIYRQHFDPQYLDPNKELIKNGLHQDYGLSVRGGLENVTYYASASFLDSEGSFINNDFRRANGRINVSFALGDFNVDLSANASNTFTELPINDNVTSGVLTSIQLGNPVTQAYAEDPWGGSFFPAPYNMSRERTQEFYRYIGGVTLGHSFGDLLSQRLTVGVDVQNGERIEYNPYAQGVYSGHQGLLLGSKSVQRRTNLQTNIDYFATLSTPVSSAITSQLSVGGQLFVLDRRSATASGNDFPSPGLTFVNAAGRNSASETQTRYATGGFAVEEQLGFNDIFYLTGGVRVDGSSVFGENFGLQTYPKIAASYVIGEEDWFNLPGVSSLRLRAGFGMAGQQPGAFDALRTFVTTTGVGGVTGFRTGSLGNPDLKPEVSRELELGFDAGLMGERLSLNANFYHQVTKDALVDLPSAPSLGFPGTVRTNAGEVRNRGLELQSDFTLVDRPSLRWSVGAGYSYNQGEVTDLPGLAFIQVDRFGTRIVEGYPLPSKWERVTVGFDDAGMPIVSDTAHYLGNGIPPHNGNLSTDVRWDRLRLAVTAAWAHDYLMSHLVAPYAYARRTGEDYFRDLAANGGVHTDEMEARRLSAQNAPGDWYENISYLRVREVTLSYAPAEGFLWGTLGSSPRFFVTARNPLLFTNYTGTDPEIVSTGSDSHSVGSDYFSVPNSRQFLFGLDFTF